MGVAKKTRKFAQVKRVIGRKDERLQKNKVKAELAGKEKGKKNTTSGEVVKEAPQMPSHMFFQHNEALVPPYNVLTDTNFFNHAVRNKLDIVEQLMDCLYAKCNVIVTDCVLAELEKLGERYRLALRVAKDPRFARLTCQHKGTYADQCLTERVTQNRIYCVATNDKDLIRSLRKIPGVPIINVARGKFVVERLPNAADHK